MSFILRCIVSEAKFCHNVSVQIQQLRNHKLYVAPTLRELARRKAKMPAAPPPKRSNFLEWNYGAEIYAFSNRLGEQFEPSMLRRAFTTPGYARKSADEQAKLGLSEEATLEHNEDLANEGRSFVSQYITGYLRICLPRLPEPGIRAIHDHLLSEPVLADISFHIGTKDLILCEEHEPSASSLATTLCAVFATLSHTSPERASLLARDLVITQLAEKSIADLWAPENPWDALQDVLKREGRGEPEARLAHEAGAGTLLHSSCVAVFSERCFIGKGFGESVVEAKQMAALDALRSMFGTSEAMSPLPLQPGNGPGPAIVAKALSKPNPAL